MPFFLISKGNVELKFSVSVAFYLPCVPFHDDMKCIVFDLSQLPKSQLNERKLIY